jgi:hypothetical protein
MYVIFMTNYSFSQRRCPVNNETLLMTDFVNLKIRTAQSFRCAHNDRVCVHIFIRMNNHIYIYKYLCLYCVSLKKKNPAVSPNKNHAKSDRTKKVALAQGALRPSRSRPTKAQNGGCLSPGNGIILGLGLWRSTSSQTYSEHGRRSSWQGNRHMKR